MTTAPGVPRPFSHRESGTPEAVWLGASEWDRVGALDLGALLDGREQVVVVAAHPDDETLSAGLLLAALHDVGAPLTVLIATAGEASHPDSRTWSRELLAQTRRAEAEAAIATLAPSARLVHTDLPDTGLASHEDLLAARLADLVDATTVLVAPWSLDGHTDHDAAGRVAKRCADATGALLLQYPLWLWHWGEPADLPWERVLALEGTPATLARKAEALARHRSQVEPLGPLPGDEATLGPGVLRRAHRLIETFIGADAATVAQLTAAVDTPDGEDFDAMYADSDDPWGFAASFYESRKRDLVTAVLRRPHYGAVLEVGCADGALTAHLAERSDSVTALDVSGAALTRARARGLAGCTFVQGAAPKAVPKGPFDLVILSEVGYFMRPLEWLDTCRRCRAALAPGGEVVLVDWSGDTEDIPLTGRLVHAQALGALGLPVTAAYRDAEVAVHVLGGPETLAGS